jgi:hypothetical protein
VGPGLFWKDVNIDPQILPTFAPTLNAPDRARRIFGKTLNLGIQGCLFGFLSSLSFVRLE